MRIPLILAGCAALPTVLEAVSVSPIVNRELETSVVAHNWPSTPQSILCEAFVYHYSENVGDFLQALVHTKPPQQNGGTTSSIPTYASAVEAVLAATPLQGTARRLLQTSLAMRAHSPHCELYRKLARETLLQQRVPLDQVQDAFVVVNGGALVENLEHVDYASLLKGAATDDTDGGDDDDDETLLLPQETVLFGDAPAVILYANLGSEKFRALFQKFQTEEIPVVVRHLGVVGFEEDSSKASGTVLQGYGVRLDIRNVEYKVFDDRKTADETAPEEEIDLATRTGLTAPSQFLAGLNVTKLGLDKDLLAQVWAVHHQEDVQASIIPPVWRRRHLPLQAATAIVQGSSDPLVTLQQIAQDLPSLASTLVHLQVPEEVREAASFVQEQRVRPGTLYMNGMPMALDSPSFNVFELLSILREEQTELEHFQAQLSTHLPSHAALKDVQEAWTSGEAFFKDNTDGHEEDAGPGIETSIRVDVARGWKKGAIVYVNDVEKDPQYANWPTSTRQMLMGMQMGQPPIIRRNLFTILAVMDPVRDTHNSGMNLVLQLIQSQYPARLGLLLIDKDHLQDCAAFLAKEENLDAETPCPVKPIVDYHMKIDEMEIEPVGTQAVQRLLIMAQRDMQGYPGTVKTYFEYMLGAIRKAHDGGVLFSLKDLLDMHGRLYEGLHVGKANEARADAVKNLLLEDENGDYLKYGHAVRFAVERGLKPGMSFLNGRPLPTDIMDESINRIFGEEQNHVLQLVLQGEITDRAPKSVYGHLLKGDNVYQKSHPLLSGADDGDKYVDLKDTFGVDSMVMVSSDASESSAVFVVDGVFDIDTETGVKMASTFLSIMQGFLPNKSLGTKIGVAFRVLPSTETSAKSSLCPMFAHASLIENFDLKSVLEHWNTEMTLQDIVKKMRGLSKKARAAILSEDTAEMCASQTYLTGSLPDERFVVANGRILPVTDGLSREDIELLLSIEMKRSTSVTQLLAPHLSWKGLGDFLSASRVASFLAMQADSPKIRSSLSPLFAKFKDELSDLGRLLLSYNSDDLASSDEALRVQITAVVDPVSEAAQRISPILLMIRDQLQLPLDVLLAPPEVLQGDSKSVPLTSYYRFVMDLDGPADVDKPKAYFSNMPANHVLTLQTDVPEPWNVQQTAAIQDTDNLRCDVQSGCGDAAVTGSFESVPLQDQSHLTSVEYGLNSLLVFGQCYEAGGSPPNGLQLTIVRETELGLAEPQQEGVEVGMDGTVSASVSVLPGITPDRLDYSDSLVMKNVGYWQLRANPGVWKLTIAEKSKGADMFDMVEGSARGGQLVVDKNSVPKSSKTLILQDFVNRGELLVVQRKPGITPEMSLFHSQENSPDADDNTVHVFSLATGHLYERFLKIMMLSVTKRTTAPVKFWLFENFLSPTFKSSAKAMAKRIGCEVEFVTYKWPQWLRGQSEKQRIIWGYKILFLDVLFPLNVKKIIYVDADQVVRGDLKELWDMDLQGAPYGYTPFCSSREETLGYQFWREGFWKTHLRGKPYHISALYVVDLELFRRSLVGDTLRSVYQQLSSDPGSLSNLDQDLPNYAQHSVPIFSLPQEWLWCESWCSDDTKAAAKTIDLCNNPMHKEPKVSMAKRVISGELFEESWVELDAEVEQYEQEFRDAQASIMADS